MREIKRFLVQIRPKIIHDDGFASFIKKSSSKRKFCWKVLSDEIPINSIASFEQNMRHTKNFQISVNCLVTSFPKID